MIAVFETKIGSAIIEDYTEPINQSPKRTLYFIRAYVSAHEYAPTLSELAALTGLSKSAARSQRDRLAEAGYLTVAKGVARGMRLT